MSLTLQLVSSKPSPFKVIAIFEMQMLKRPQRQTREVDELSRTL